MIRKPSNPHGIDAGKYGHNAVVSPKACLDTKLEKSQTNNNQAKRSQTKIVGQISPGLAHVGQKVWIQDSKFLWRIGEIQLMGTENERPSASPTSTNSDDFSVQVYVPDAPESKLQWIPVSQVFTFDASHIINHEDIAQMNNMHEAPLINILRQRFEQDEIYTFTADILLSINPYKTIPLLYDVGRYMQEQSIVRHKKSFEESDNCSQQRGVVGNHSELLSQDGSKRPPHLFTIADKAYTNMRGIADTGTPQSIIITGESGAGKTEASKYIMKYLATASKLAASDQNTTTRTAPAEVENVHEKIEECVMLSNLVLESFGNAKTSRNHNSSRFGKYIQIHYSSSGRMTMVSVRHFLLEKTRLVLPPPNERNYHIFYQLVAGMGGEDPVHGIEDNHERERAIASQLGLHPDVWRYEFLAQGECVNIDGVDDAAEFSQLCSCMEELGLTSEKFQIPLFEILAAILHLGNVRFEETMAHEEASTSEDRECTQAVFPDDIETPQNLNTNSRGITLEFVSSLLGIPPAEFSHKMVTQTTITARGSILQIKLTPEQARNALDAFCKYLYGELFNYLIARINLYAKENTVTDRANVSAPKSVKRNISTFQDSFIGILDIFGFEIMARNSLEQLCINYTNETLQQQFNKHVFILEQERYAQEGIEFDIIEFQDNQVCLDLIQKPPSGLLPLLEEQMILKRKTTTDKQLLTIYHTTHLDKHAHYKKPRFDCDEFVIHHYAGEVAYDIHGFLAKNTDNLHDDLLELLRRSSHILLRSIFHKEQTGSRRCSTTPAPVAVLSPTSAARRTQNSLLAGSMTVTSRFRSQLSELMEVLWATTPNYIKCIKPNNVKFPGGFSCELVRDQLRYSGILEVVRIRQEGFPIRKRFDVFLQLFWPLLIQLKVPNIADPSKDPQQCRILCDQIALEYLQKKNYPFSSSGTCPSKEVSGTACNKRYYAMGRFEVFLRYGQLERLQTFKEALLIEKAIVIQKVLARGRVLYKKYKLFRLGMIAVQAKWRMHLDRSRFLAQKSNSIRIQARYRGWRTLKMFLQAKSAANTIFWRVQRYLTRQKCKRYTAMRDAAQRVQCCTRGYLARTRVERQLRLQRKASLQIQTCFRMQRCRQPYQRLRRCVTRLQARQRGKNCLQRYVKEKYAAIAIAAMIKSWSQRRRFRVLKQQIVHIQALIRQHGSRKQFVNLRKQAIRIQSIQRQQKACQIVQTRRSAVHKLQHYIFCWSIRIRYSKTRQAIQSMQHYLKSWSLRREFTKSKLAARKIQCVWRKHVRNMHWRKEVALVYGCTVKSVPKPETMSAAQLHSNASYQRNDSPPAINPSVSTLQYNSKMKESELRIEKLRNQPHIFLRLQPKAFGYNLLLHHAAITGDIHVIKYIFEVMLSDDPMQARQMFFDINQLGRTAFHEACAHGQYESARFFLSQVQRIELQLAEQQSGILSSKDYCIDGIKDCPAVERNKIVYKGYLRKRRETSRWIRRFVTLAITSDNHAFLVYYRNEKAFDARSNADILPKTVDLQAALIKKSMDVPFAFEVHSPHLLSVRNKQGRLYFAAENELENQQWLGQLRNMIPNTIESRLFAMHRASKYGKLEYINFDIRKHICNHLVRKSDTAMHVSEEDALLHKHIASMHLAASIGAASRDTSAAAAQKDEDDTIAMGPIESEIIKTVLWLIENGADINARDWKGQTPLKCALIANNQKLAKHLLDRGALASGLNATELGQVQQLKASLAKNAITSVSCASPRNAMMSFKSSGMNSPTSLGPNKTLSFLQRSTESSSAVFGAFKKRYITQNSSKCNKNPSEGGQSSNPSQEDLPVLFLQKQPGKIRHSSYVSIFVESIGLANPKALVRPRVIISVVGIQRNLVEMQQQVSIQPLILSSSLLWSFTWHMQTPLENLPHGACVVFELAISPREGSFMKDGLPFATDPIALNDKSTPTTLLPASDGSMASDADTFLPVCWTYVQVDQRTANTMALNTEMYTYPMDLTLKKLQRVDAFLCGDILISQGPE